MGWLRDMVGRALFRSHEEATVSEAFVGEATKGYTKDRSAIGENSLAWRSGQRSVVGGSFHKQRSRTSLFRVSSSAWPRPRHALATRRKAQQDAIHFSAARHTHPLRKPGIISPKKKDWVGADHGEIGRRARVQPLRGRGRGPLSAGRWQLNMPTPSAGTNRAARVCARVIRGYDDSLDLWLWLCEGSFRGFGRVPPDDVSVLFFLFPFSFFGTFRDTGVPFSLRGTDGDGFLRCPRAWHGMGIRTALGKGRERGERRVAGRGHQGAFPPRYLVRGSCTFFFSGPRASRAPARSSKPKWEKKYYLLSVEKDAA